MVVVIMPATVLLMEVTGVKEDGERGGDISNAHTVCTSMSTL